MDKLKAYHWVLVAIVALIAGFLLIKHDPPRESASSGEKEAATKSAAEARSGLSALSRTASRSLKPVGKEAIKPGNTYVADKATLEAYLEEQNYSAEAMLAVVIISGDQELLVDAARRHPDDPNIQLAVISRGVLLEERREWVERFKESQPDNMLSAIYLAGELLASGEIEAGLAEMQLAAEIDGYKDFALETEEALERAMVDLGQTPLQARVRSAYRWGYFVPVKESLNQLHQLAQQSEDPAQRTAMANVGFALGHRFWHGEAEGAMINMTVGTTQSAQFARMLDQETIVPEAGISPAQFFENDMALIPQRNRLQEGFDRAHELTEPQFMHFAEMMRTHGHLEASNYVLEQLEELAEQSR